MTNEEKQHLAPLLNVVESILSNQSTNILENDYEHLKKAYNDWERYRMIIEYKKAERDTYAAKNFEMYKEVKKLRQQLENTTV